jgi:DNA-binding SARP family transcriptional activator
VRRSAGLQILAFLALHPDGATTTELTRAVWPGLPPHTITNRLHTTLSDLRKQLHPLLGDDPISRHDDRYHLNHAAIDTDLAAVRAATSAVTHAATAGQRRAACQTLVDAYRGDLAAGHPWPWLQPLREALRRDVLDAYQHLAATATPDRAV